MPTVNSNSAAMFALNKMTITERDMTQLWNVYHQANE